MLITNPKKNHETEQIKPSWYNYYAGYSHTFTKNIINSCNLNKSAIILDPWNGTGTTTLMASTYGYRSIGIDLNPVMKVIAKAKLASMKDVSTIENHLFSLKLTGKYSTSVEDPLLTWFDHKSVGLLRRIEQRILANKSYKTTASKIDEIDTSQGLMYVALFNTVRHFLKHFIPSNPTWVKKPKSPSEKISLSTPTFKRSYLANLQRMVDEIKSDGSDLLTEPNIIVGSSTAIPLEDNYADLVLTSPPYCTRIDYGVATSPELSITTVGGSNEINSIRRQLMGSTTVPKNIDINGEVSSRECLNFLNKVKKHSSISSETYYYKNYAQYFLLLARSLGEIARVLKKDCNFICVIQDSYYKDIHCNLPKILIEMGKAVQLQMVEIKNFESKQNMANVNRQSKKYRDRSLANEAVVVFKKG